MTTAGLSQALAHLRTTLAQAGGPSDGQLLARFAATRDEAAFAALVGRHGRMVLGVCRRMLRHEQDAEDAFQAVFLVLARKAGALRCSDTAGPWLYEVAVRTAQEARAVNARRSAREMQVEELPQPAVAPLEPQDWRPLFDEELARLPAKYRSAVVLCELEGRPRREAATLLGVPDGTLSSRLAAARKILAQRLRRRGLALPACSLAAALAEGAAAASPAVVHSTVKSALLMAAGLQVAATAPAAVLLMKEVIRTMFLMKLKSVAAVVLVASALGAGVVFQAGKPAPARAQAPGGKPLSELEALKKENELLKLNLKLVLEKVGALEAELRTVKARGGKPQTTAFSPDGRTLNTVVDGKVRVWDSTTGQLLREVMGGKAPDTEVVGKALGEVVKKAGQGKDGKEELARVVEELEKVLKKLRDQLKQPAGSHRPQKK
jgi:RNA polymerase sigma factor (sigma-70 family)